MIEQSIIMKNLKKINLRCRWVLSAISIIILVLSVVSFKIMWDIETLKVGKDNAIYHTIDNKWSVVESYLNEIQNENYLYSERMSKNIIADLTSHYSSEALSSALSNLGLDNKNPVQVAVGKEIRGVYFRNILTDANDPFAMVIGREGEKDSFIFADFSENCAVNELTRNMEQEYKMHANEDLARKAFSDMIQLKYGRPLENSIFFQFEPKHGGVPLSSLDFKGIKKSFFDNKGDIYLTFNSLEFLAPYYIYRDRDITGKARIEGRVRTDARILAIVSDCSPYEVINNDKDFTLELMQYDNAISSINTVFVEQERTLLITGILVLVLLLVSFIALWVIFESTNKRGNIDDAAGVP